MMVVDLRAGLDQRRLRALLEEGRRRAFAVGHPVVTSLVAPAPPCDPLAFFARAGALRGAPGGDDRLLFMHPSEGGALAGAGVAWSLEAHGKGRFRQAAASWSDLFAGALVDDSTSAGAAGPLLLGGFSFDPARPRTALWSGYPDGLLVLPRYLLTRRDDRTWLTLTTLLGPHSDTATEMAGLLEGYRTLLYEPSPGAAPRLPRSARGEDAPQEGDGLVVDDAMPAERWQAIVGRAAAEMRSGDLEKVVLARECRVEGQQAFDPSRALAQLRGAYPSCFIFAVARGEHCFLGATPERLVRLRGGEVQAMSLAGSIARGATPQEDQRLGEQLLASAKDQAEHAVVVRALTEGLAGLCTSIAAPAEPVLLKVHNVQHLLTMVGGRARRGTTILELVERLHPTPAVGGYPRARALRLIRERESMDRGWYAGPVGWVDARGDGEFAVALRSALLHGQTRLDQASAAQTSPGAQATIFAGCGIVAGSDPAAEYAESCLKLRPMLAALKASMS